MEQFYQVCAILGGTIFAGQFLLSLLGLAGDHDITGDSGGDHFGGDHSVGSGHDGAGGETHHGGADRPFSHRNQSENGTGLVAPQHVLLLACQHIQANHRQVARFLIQHQRVLILARHCRRHHNGARPLSDLTKSLGAGALGGLAGGAGGTGTPNTQTTPPSGGSD